MTKTKRNHLMVISICFVFITILFINNYYHPGVIDYDDTIVVEGKLATHPYHRTHFENPNYIELNLTDFDKSFRISYCAYSLINVQQILSLSTFDLIQITVLKEELYKEIRPMINHPVKVYGLKINGDEIITLNDYNKCKRNKWKGTLLLYPLLVAYLISVLVLYR